MTQDHEQTALIDIDGTLADYEGAMRAALTKLLAPGETLPSNLYRDGVPQYLEERMRLIKRQPGFWRGLKPITAGMRVFDLLGELGYSRMILTKGPKRTTAAWTEKAEWCAAHVPDAGIMVVRSGKDDGPHKGLVYGKILFDDFPPYIEQWLKWRPRGKVLMLDAAHNKDFTHKNVLRVQRYAYETKAARMHEKEITSFLQKK